MGAGYEEQEGQHGKLHHASVGLEELKHQKSPGPFSILHVVSMEVSIS